MGCGSSKYVDPDAVLASNFGHYATEPPAGEPRAATAEAGRQVPPSSSVDEERSRRRSAALGFSNSAPEMP